MKANFKLKDTKAMRELMGNYLSNAGEIASYEAGMLVAEMIKKKINEWYDTYDPVFYNRSKEYLDAIEVVKVTSTKYRKNVEIQFNLDAMSYPQHKIMGTEYADTFPDKLEKGWIMPNGIEREGSHAFEETEKELSLSRSEFRRKIAAFLEGEGYTVDVKYR